MHTGAYRIITFNTLKHTHTYSLAHSLAHTHSHSHSPILTAHTRTQSHSSHTHSYSPHSHPHTHLYSLTFTHTHSPTHTLTYTHSPSPIPTAHVQGPASSPVVTISNRSNDGSKSSIEGRSIPHRAHVCMSTSLPLLFLYLYAWPTLT